MPLTGKSYRMYFPNENKPYAMHIENIIQINIADDVKIPIITFTHQNCSVYTYYAALIVPILT